MKILQINLRCPWISPCTGPQWPPLPPWVASASALTCPYTEADAVSGQPHHFALHSFGPLLLGFQMPAPASLCLRDFSVATGACSAHELGKWKCYRYMISPGQLSNSDWQEQVGTCPSSLTCWVGSWPPRTPSGTELQVPTGLNGLLTHLHGLPSLSSLASPLSY